MAELKDEIYLGCDTETEGLSSHSKRMWSIQISNAAGNFGVLIPVNIWLDNDGKVSKKIVDLMAPFFADENKTFVFHNAKFDVQWLKAQGIFLSNVFCTVIAEKLLTAGKLGVNNDLKSCLKRRLGIEMSKEERKDFYNGVFLKNHLTDPLSAWTDSLINYSMSDVFPLVDLMKSQLRDIKHWNLQDTLALEMDVLHVTEKMEYIGIGIDAEGCRKFQEDMSVRAAEELKTVLSELQPVWEKVWRKEYSKNIAKWDEWKLKKSLVVKSTNKRVNGKLTEDAIIQRQEADLLKPFKSKPKEKGELKLRSSLPMRQTLYAYCGLAIGSTSKETLESFRQDYPILEKILEYKKYSKLAEFGELYDKIDPYTKRIHASYNQIVSTGRFSCSDPNLQQIPSRTDEGIRLRSLFQSRKGYKFVGADFAGIELVILGVLGKDKVLIDAVNSGKDIHCYTISRMLNCRYEDIFNAKEGNDYDFDHLTDARTRFEKVFDLPLVSASSWDEKGLRKWVKALRNDVKTLTYGIAYQMSKYGLARKFHCTVENAELFIETFFDVYKGVGKYISTIGTIGYNNGFSETRLGRKRFFRQPKAKTQETIISEVCARLEKEGINIDAMSEGEWRSELYDAIALNKKEVNQQISAIKREAANMPIQGMSADITKLSMVYFNDYLVDHGFPEDEGLILVVHDELIGECKEENSELMAKLLKDAMVEAAVNFLGTGVNIEVDPYIDTYWKK